MTTHHSTPSSTNGKVYLVGAGPGDPGLITLRGKYLLEHAEVVVYDYLANPKLLSYVPKTAQLIYAGKKGGGLHAFTQQGINRLLVDHAQQGKMVVRLKGGDPFIFGRGAEEIEELVSEGIDFEVVPGVTSATAAATYAGIPITHREYTASVAFVTGHEDPTKKFSNISWEKLATGAGTIVIYMGIKTLPSITQKLIDHGRSPDTPVAVVRWASTPQQRSVVGTLATICDVVAQADIKPPALVIVGEVVKLRSTIDWFEKRPLFGRRIVVTRTREQASDLVAKLEEYGAECLEYSTIHIEPVADYRVLDQALAEIHAYAWLLFTSLNAVTYFFQRLFVLGHDSRHLAGTKIAVVGKATAEELKKYGLKADLIPDKFTGEGLAKALVETEVNGSRILLPRALKASDLLPETLIDAGAEVTIAPVYQNVPPQGRKEELRDQLESGSIDLITFTSSSTVTNFLAMLDAGSDEELHRLMDAVRIAAIGPITAETVREHGLRVDIQPERYTIDDMVHAIVAAYRNKPGQPQD
ncbi:uroporphyrinogen-III C-methyltransferase; uroporphyrinogen-III synthase [Desulfobulbus propionicus DSM 2032]|uniref:uroporphyrinogen-III C-methyltransferase n=1 Tax=Desulfobulbus propionicus (strain ATCC 33891 / DSM 2032 / VKM B-1956 / 1pr3) TaxID=577650 RepID=A0A7U4DQ38_DESPD|nr:uroporphyrinogen-III C-methyltransferase [Desulfobulbus propionicus]ADW18712.1 uroporphyrinogen-III C-methyltransferase; uroporphyrinogen-III synthase [Desulfobulbus propionicus DSM 2032]